MNTYDRFLFLLLAEFQRKAPAHIQSLWIDWMDLEAATDDRMRFAVARQALRRIRALERAANAVHSHRLRACAQVLERRLKALTHEPSAACPELFEALFAATNELSSALSAVDVDTFAAARAGQPTEEELFVGSCAG